MKKQLAAQVVLGNDYWGIGLAADRRFKHVLLNIVSLLLLMFIAAAFWKVEVAEAPPIKPAASYALELLPAPKVKPKPVVKAAPVVKHQVASKPKVSAKKAAPANPVPAISAQERAQTLAAAAAQRQAAAKAAAAKAGVMAFSEQLAQLRDNSSDVVISDKSLRERGAVKSELVEPSTDLLSASKLSAGHGDYGKRSVSGEQNSTAIGGHRTEALAGVSVRSVPAGASTDGAVAGVEPSRSLEEIQLAFDRSKTAFFAIFNRAARKDSTIRAGTVVVSLTIEADGSVSDCNIVSSSFFNSDLKAKLLQRVALLKFEAKAVPRYTYPNYPISYMP
ncbi:hypothetical protein AB4876_12525 [Zhongshania guokunii]|uniref:TonB C-terminal domain-containing protein n=1 Tax=Zhongshania guokunii TaxID=641783 RepID=A0ABV3U836_9GAMM